eukprot:4199330-Amphidinium_carterae.1
MQNLQYSIAYDDFQHTFKEDLKKVGPMACGISGMARMGLIQAKAIKNPQCKQTRYELDIASRLSDENVNNYRNES